jgi:hypothetical protein
MERHKHEDYDDVGDPQTAAAGARDLLVSLAPRCRRGSLVVEEN